VTRDEYCVQVCGGKCCTHPVTKVRCPRQCADGSCGIYEHRYVRIGALKQEIVGFYEHDGKTLAFECGQILDLIAAKSLAPEVEAQCCYARPELLNQEI
jgi:hypothetical protein